MLTAPLLALALAASPDLLTTAEKTGFERTGRADEAVRLCRAHAAAFRRRARCITFGTSPEGRALVALVASADGTLDARAARAKGRPVVLLQGGVHAGEIEGKDAGFQVLRELLGSADGGPLASVTVVFVPIFNVDGHERFAPNHRPNQRGPAEAGWRTTAQNLNLNRDFVKADAPETRALLRLLEVWDPIVFADLHATDGAQFEPDVAVVVEPRDGYAEALRGAGRSLSDALLARLAATGHLPLDFYPAFRTDSDPASGFASGVAPPRFAHGYWAARNRLGLLVETHSWRPYAHRVRTTADVLRALLELAASEGPAWRRAADAADRAGAAGAGEDVALAWQPGEPTRTLEFRGYAYTRDPSPVTGAPLVAYDETRPAVWRVPFAEKVAPSATTTLPRGGWIVPAAWAPLAGEKLALHGIAFDRLAAREAVPVEAWHAGEVTFAAEPTEGRHRVSARGAWSPEVRALSKGALWVPVAQPRALLAATLLAPESPDGLLAWGFLSVVLEKKEYLEDYVLEPFAKELLVRDAAVRAEFERRLGDPAFARDPAVRLAFFYPRHPAADAAWRVYPVLRAAAKP